MAPSSCFASCSEGHEFSGNELEAAGRIGRERESACPHRGCKGTISGELNALVEAGNDTLTQGLDEAAGGGRFDEEEFPAGKEELLAKSGQGEKKRKIDRANLEMPASDPRGEGGSWTCSHVHDEKQVAKLVSAIKTMVESRDSENSPKITYGHCDAVWKRFLKGNAPEAFFTKELLSYMNLLSGALKGNDLVNVMLFCPKKTFGLESDAATIVVCRTLEDLILKLAVDHVVFTDARTHCQRTQNDQGCQPLSRDEVTPCRILHALHVWILRRTGATVHSICHGTEAALVVTGERKGDVWRPVHMDSGYAEGTMSVVVPHPGIAVGTGCKRPDERGRCIFVMQRGYVVLAKAVANGRKLAVEFKTEEAVYEELVSTLSGAGIHRIAESLKDVAVPFTPEVAVEDPRWQWLRQRIPDKDEALESLYELSTTTADGTVIISITATLAESIAKLYDLSLDTQSRRGN
eukprot:CAMPEP_0182906682 /NCGR_PEP_ID=MMETSP0034_2-20130328/33922_1 /TAXON_ID=156128 /ORGANISM="Nephroselmis pyriformis, Strain CCMP717" /LENGTH=463 /DNA_ID=CAMNT_0025042421 /DNA_START=399 /DNA_END=1790 /DNA_ORIENTATION=-